jgi:hypothetical protein
VELAVYDVAGARVATLLDCFREGGAQEATWNGRDDAGRAVPSGHYFYRLRQGALRESGKMVLVR